MDVSGEHQSDLKHSVWKERFDSNGARIDNQMVEKQGEFVCLSLSSAFFRKVFFFTDGFRSECSQRYSR